MSVYGICRDADGRLLLARAAAWLTVAGRWFLPGGGLDHGEDPVDCLRRELLEETGLDVEVGPLRGVLTDTTVLPDGTELHTIRIIYAIDRWRGELRPEEQGTTDMVRWVDADELAQLPVVPYVTRALTELG